MFDKPRWQNARDRGGGQDDQRKRNGIEHSIQDGQGKLENPYKQESDRVRVGIGQCGTVIEPFGKECAFGLLFKLDIGRIFKTVDLFSLQLVQAFFPVCFPGYKILIETDAAYEHFPAAVAPPSGSGLPELLQSAENRISTIQIQKKQKKQLFDRMRQSEHPPVRRLFETAEDLTGQGEAASRDA